MVFNGRQELNRSVHDVLDDEVTFTMDNHDQECG